MIHSEALNDRSRAILRQVVSHYISSGGPVGSRSVARRHAEQLSSATIRNVMSDLEEMGYLQQPHTSAGRVPTDKGYRFFVDQLVQPYSLPEDPGFLDQYVKSNSTLEGVLANACENLSKNSNQTGLVMLPGFSQMLFRHIEFVRVGKNEMLAAFISEMGILQNKIIPIEGEMTQEKLSSISKYLNEEFSGKSLKTIQHELVFRIKSEREHYDQLMNKAVELWSKTFSEEDKIGELLVDGATNFLDHPDFAVDLEKMKAIIKTIEDKTKLVKLLDTCLKQDGMTVIIGEESHDEDIQGCSLVAENYRLGGQKMGTMAVFGPKRMDYERVIAVVNHTAKTVSKLLSVRNEKEFE